MKAFVLVLSHKNFILLWRLYNNILSFCNTIKCWFKIYLIIFHSYHNHSFTSYIKSVSVLLLQKYFSIDINLFSEQVDKAFQQSVGGQAETSRTRNATMPGWVPSPWTMASCSGFHSKFDKGLYLCTTLIMVIW